MRCYFRCASISYSHFTFHIAFISSRIDKNVPSIFFRFLEWDHCVHAHAHAHVRHTKPLDNTFLLCSNDILLKLRLSFIRIEYQTSLFRCTISCSTIISKEKKNNKMKQHFVWSYSFHFGERIYLHFQRLLIFFFLFLFSSEMENRKLSGFFNYSKSEGTVRYSINSAKFKLRWAMKEKTEARC